MPAAAETLIVDIRIDSKAAATQMKNLAGDMKKTRTAAESLSSSFSKLNRALGILAGANIASAMLGNTVDLIDSYRELGGRINLVAQNTVGLTKAQEDLNVVAQETYSSYEAIGSLYARTGLAADQLGLSHQNLLDVSRTVANTLRLSGASAQEARSSMLQLSQAIASGTLSGDEFKSQTESNAALLKLLTERLGLSRKELKKMADEQKLSAEVFIPALIAATEEYQQLVENLPVTVGRAVTVMKNEWQKLLATSNGTVGSLDLLAEVILLVAKNLGLLTKALIAFTVVLYRTQIAFFVTQLVAARTAAFSFAAALTAVGKAIRFAFRVGVIILLIDTVNVLIGEFRRFAQVVDEMGIGMWDSMVLAFDLAVQSIVGGFLALGNTIAALAEGTGAAFAAAVRLEDPGAAFAEYFQEGILSRPIPERIFEIAATDLYEKYRKAVLKLSEKKPIAPPLKPPVATTEDLDSKQETFLNNLDKRVFKLKETNILLAEELKLVGASDAVRAEILGKAKLSAELAEIQLLAEQKGLDLTNKRYVAAIEGYEKERLAIIKRNQELKKAETLYNQSLEWAEELGDAMLEFAQGGADAFKNMAESILKDLARILLRINVVLPLAAALKSLLEGTAIGGAITSAAGVTGSANGNAFSGGNVVPFASGGIINGPTLAPMALMGEAGPEAVMPLTRHNGKLGVEASGNGTVVNVFNNAANTETRTEERTNSNGSKSIDVYIEEAVNKAMTSGRMDRQMNRNFGLSRVGAM